MSRDVPPSLGGKYSGFGYTMEHPPKSQSQELLDTAFSSFATVIMSLLTKHKLDHETDFASQMNSKNGACFVPTPNT